MNMKDINEFKQEAIERMKILELNNNIIKDFEQEDKLYKSKNFIPLIIQLNEEEKQIVKKFEKETNLFVYHVIHSISSLGETYDLLYISQNKDEWKDEKQDLINGFTVSKTIVINYKINSEIGIIGIKNNNGGVIRIC